MRNSSNWLSILKIMLQGASFFWIPDILINAITKGNYYFGIAIGVIVITILVPVLCLRRLYYYCNSQKIGIAPLPLALAMLLGIWLFGPLGTMISASFNGGGFSKSFWETLVMVGTFTLQFPLYTFIMSAYDGALGALIIVTISLPIVGVVFSLKKRKLRGIT